ncbi:glutamyl-tRNA synthetase [Aeromonas media]|uniref:Glutamyl-tRNA synthetase n=1 Tax=Aeromonas media TaxID=651 RepID=A0AAP6G8Z6_AERME|nr:glutamyl-tRNA synthetase [Aeromonas media]MDX7920821.1 glutamyl-tRNA synthetase [Aeromonas media]
MPWPISKRAWQPSNSGSPVQARPPAIDAVMALVGKERVLARIDRALAYIEARMAAE